MRNRLFTLAVALGIVALAPAALLGGKPPRPGNAQPEITFLEGSSIQVANRDGSNKVTLYSNKNAYLVLPQMSPDHLSVVFREMPARGEVGFRRTTFQVVNGNVVVGSTETIFQGNPGSDFAFHPLEADGTRFAFVAGNAIYEMWKERDCPTDPCTLDTIPPPLYVSAGYLWDLLGGYTANGRALYFQEGQDPQSGVPVDILRLEFGTDPEEPPVASAVLTRPYNVITFQTSRLDYSADPFAYGPFETRLLIDGESSEPYETGLRTYDTWDGTVTDILATGHYATWSPDERVLFYVNRWQNASGWIRGRLMMYDRDTGVFVQIDDFSAYPDWAALP